MRAHALSRRLYIDNSPWSYKLQTADLAPRTTSRDIRAHHAREALRTRSTIPMAKVGIDVGIPTVTRGGAQTRITTALPNVSSSSGSAISIPMGLLEAYTTCRQLVANASTHRGRASDRRHPRAFRTRRDNEVRAQSSTSSMIFCRASKRSERPRSCRCSAYSKPATRKDGTTTIREMPVPASRGLWRSPDRLRRREVPDLKKPDPAARRYSLRPAHGAGAALAWWGRFLCVPSEAFEAGSIRIRPSTRLLKPEIDRTSRRFPHAPSPARRSGLQLLNAGHRVFAAGVAPHPGWDCRKPTPQPHAQRRGCR